MNAAWWCLLAITGLHLIALGAYMEEGKNSESMVLLVLSLITSTCLIVSA